MNIATSKVINCTPLLGELRLLHFITGDILSRNRDASTVYIWLIPFKQADFSVFLLTMQPVHQGSDIFSTNSASISFMCIFYCALGNVLKHQNLRNGTLLP